NHEPLTVGGHVEAKDRVNGSSRFGADGEKRCRGAEMGFRREPYWNRLHASSKAKIEKLLPIPSPPHRLSACSRNKVAFANHARRIARPKSLDVNFGAAGLVRSERQPFPIG